MKKIWLIFILLFSYQFFFGTFIFVFDITQESNISFNLSVLEDEPEDAKVLLIHDNEEALAMRLAMIKQSTSTIRIAVHQFKDDATANLIATALIEKLGEGVEVEILVDGVMNPNLQQENYLLLLQHGAKLKAYEPNVLLLPYKTQNRLHDKLMIFDDTYAIIGGRNIGDRYFIKDASAVNDRDVLIFNDNLIASMTSYFEELMTSKSAKDIKEKLVDRETLIAFNQKYDDYQSSHHLETIYIDALNRMIPVEGMMFVHNPINRLKKEAVVLDTLIELVLKEESATLQSPYIVFDQYLEEQFHRLEELEITLITNTIATSPNIFASSGYLHDKDQLADKFKLYEIQSQTTRHTKTWFIGTKYLAVGSFNIDPRSTSLSTESMVIIKSEDLYNLAYAYINEDLASSLRVTKSGDYITSEIVSHIEEKPFKELLIKTVGVFTYFFHSLL